MNNRIYQESQNRKALTNYLYNLLSNYEISEETAQLLARPQVEASNVKY